MKKLWPAVVALIALVAIYLVMRGHRDGDAPPATPAQATATEPGAPPSHAAPGLPASAQPGEPGAAGVGDEADGSAVGSGPIVGTPTPPDPAPDMTPKKGKMTLDEQLAETAKHIDVMKHRTELLQADIDKLDKAGKTKEAAEQRVVLERLQKHMKELQTAIDEHKEPM